MGPRSASRLIRSFSFIGRLSPFEIPPSLSKAFGAKKVLIVMSAESASIHAGLAKAWSRDGVETVMDSQLDTLPADRPRVVFGAGNKFAPVVAEALKTLWRIARCNRATRGQRLL